MGINDIIRNRLVNNAIVISKKKITENVFHLIIKGDCLKSISYQIGQHLHVLVQPEIKGSIIDIIVNRNYSIWNHSATEGILEMAICNNSDGIGAKWIQNLKCNAIVYFTNPTGSFVLSSRVNTHIFIGDASALGHFYFMKRNLSANDSFFGLIYGTDKENYFPDLDNTFPFEFIDQSSNLVERLENKIVSATKANFNDTMIYLGGNGDISIAMYKLLKEKYKLKKRNITIKPFWKAGKKGL